MADVPLPDDFDADVITVAGTHDHLYGEADVNLDDRRHARHLKVNEGEPGVVSVNANYADAVAAFLGTSVGGSTDDSTDETIEASDEDDDADSGDCEVILTSGDREGEPCGRDLPCRFHGGAED